MSARRVLVAAVQLPYQRGGAEWHVQALHQQLESHGFVSDIVSLPFQWHPPIEALKSSLAWRLLDFTHAADTPVDLLICTKFPSYAAKHPNKIVWLFHQFRQAYDLHDAGLQGFPNTAEGRALRRRIIELDTRALKECRRIYTTSRNNARRLEHYNGLQAQVLPAPLLRPESYHCDGWDDYVLSVGRLDPLKRNDMLIRALCYLPASIRAVIVGEGAQRDHLEQLAESLGVSERVYFTGYVSDPMLKSLYANCAAVYYAPYDEDYGLVALEAFQSRKPVVTTVDAGGVLEHVHDGETGLVASNDPQHIAACLARLIERNEDARRLGANGFESIQHLRWDHVISVLTAETG